MECLEVERALVHSCPIDAGEADFVASGSRIDDSEAVGCTVAVLDYSSPRAVIERIETLEESSGPVGMHTDLPAH